VYIEPQPRRFPVSRPPAIHTAQLPFPKSFACHSYKLSLQQVLSLPLIRKHRGCMATLPILKLVTLRVRLNPLEWVVRKSAPITEHPIRMRVLSESAVADESIHDSDSVGKDLSQTPTPLQSAAPQDGSITPLEFGLIEVLIPKNFNLPRMNTYKKLRGEGQLLLTRNPRKDFFHERQSGTQEIFSLRLPDVSHGSRKTGHGTRSTRRTRPAPARCDTKH
jgi:hypothetical protein